MKVQIIEEMLGAEHTGSYVSGHMGSQILRFRRNEDGSSMVVKFAPFESPSAIEDIDANIRGYAEIQTIGGSHLVPPELYEISVPGGKALVMRDLGSSMRIVDGGLEGCNLLWRHFKNSCIKTIHTEENYSSSNQQPLFAVEVVRHIQRFLHAGISNLLEQVHQADWSGRWGVSSLMLLDFTPDNLFVDENMLSFIDPWLQDVYLGHPAVSVGQFATLMQLYKMKDAAEATNMLKERCETEMPLMLDCDITAVKELFAWDRLYNLFCHHMFGKNQIRLDLLN